MSLLYLIKKAAIDAVNQTQPVALLYGHVTKEIPLEITIEDIPYDEDFLVLTRNVCNYNSVNNKYEHNLKYDDKVILIRYQGGQKYLVLDWVVENDSEE